MKILAFSFVLLSFTVFGISCDSRTEAEKIVDAAIDAYGGALYEETAITFDFRGNWQAITALT